MEFMVPLLSLCTEKIWIRAFFYFIVNFLLMINNELGDIYWVEQLY